MRATLRVWVGMAPDRDLDGEHRELGNLMNLKESRPPEPPGGMMKRRDWALLVSLMAAQTTLSLGIGAFAFDRLEARMDRLEARMDRFEARMDRMEERLDDLDRRVARIEGILRIQADADASDAAVRPSDAGSAGSSG